VLHHITGIYTKDLGDFGIIFKFLTTITIPAALYYVGAGIHPHDLKLNEIKRLFLSRQNNNNVSYWSWVRNIFFLTVLITPGLTAFFLLIFYFLNLIPNEWFAVIMINSILPITSTNMFLVPYGIDKKVTALSITWTTIICVPIVVIMISIFGIYFL
jgi:hypothetical protein